MNDSTKTIEDLQAEAKEARTALDWETAVALYAEALDREGLTPTVAYDLLDGRAACQQKLGDYAAEAADLEQMASLAQELDDATLEVDALSRRAEAVYFLGEIASARSLAETALSMARDAVDPRLEARCLDALLRVSESLSDFERRLAWGEEALRLYRSLGDERGAARTFYQMAFLSVRQGETTTARKQAQEALRLSRRQGDREGEAGALNVIGMTHTDVARRRALYFQSLAIYEAVGNRERQNVMHNNIAGAYLKLGLYGRARDHGERVVQSAREMGARGNLAYCLDTLARAYLGWGELRDAERLFAEGLALVDEIGDRGTAGYYLLGLGRVAMARDAPDKAGVLFAQAAAAWRETGSKDSEAVALAWQGAAQLALGDLGGARDLTGKAVNLVERGNVPTEYLPQEVWWWRYWALRSPLPHPLSHKGRGETTALSHEGRTSANSPPPQVASESVGSFSHQVSGKAAGGPVAEQPGWG